MDFYLRRLPEFSGKNCTVYSAFIDNVSPFREFVDDNFAVYREEVEDILTTIQAIGRFGALEIYFKVHEGKYKDGVSALYDDPERRLRLFCIRYNEEILVLGGGGLKIVKAWQDDDDLNRHAQNMINLSAIIKDLLKNKNSDIYLDANEFSGNLVK